MLERTNICVIGSGYVGLVAAVCFAEMGHSVICVDNNVEKIDLLNKGGIPIYEDHLPELLARHRDRGVRFTTELGPAVDASEAVFIAVGTPQGNSGAADLSYIEAVVSQIAACIRGYKVLVEKSTVPAYTNEWITHCMHRHGIPSDQFDVVSNPEFLREGTAVKDFLHPDRIIVGSNNDRSTALLNRIYRPLTGGSYYAQQGSLPGPLSQDRPAKFLVTSAQSAELIKHASNAFLAMKISFINAVGNLAESVNGDIEDIALGMGLDSRIGTRFLQAGLGYGGSCFPKDVAAFSWLAKQHGMDFRMLEEVRKVNAGQQEIFFNKVKSALWTLRGKKLAVLGLAFKGGTDDIRESPAIEMVHKFLEAGCIVSAYDPAASEKAQTVLPASSAMQYAANACEAAQGADALLILTDWKEFSDLDLPRIKSLLRFPIVVDGRNLFRPSDLQALGFTYLSMGRRATPPAWSPAESRSASAASDRLSSSRSPVIGSQYEVSDRQS